MAIIGRNDIVGMGSVNQGATTNIRMNLASTIRTAVANETATTAWFYLNTGNSGQTVDVYLYDITGQTATDPDGATLEATATISLTGTAGWHSVSMSTALVSGNDYAVAMGNPSATVSTQRETGLTSGDGGNAVHPAPDPWGGTSSTVQYPAYIDTTISAGGSTPKGPLGHPLYGPFRGPIA